MVQGTQCDGVLVLHSKKTKVGTLVRVETSEKAQMYRLTVKASTPDIATTFGHVLELALSHLGATAGQQSQPSAPGAQQQQPQQQQAAAPSADPVLDIFADL